MSNEERVKEKWPDAVCSDYPVMNAHGKNWFTIRENQYALSNIISVGNTPSEAWESAASQIDKKEGI